MTTTTTNLTLSLPFLHSPSTSTRSFRARLFHSPIILSPLKINHLKTLRQQRCSIIMSWSSISQPPSITELNEESDFQKLDSHSSGLVSICGFGSLLSERSSRSTFPDLLNFRVARLNGFRRVFAHVAPIFFERGIAKSETKEISSLSVEPCEGESLIVTVFEINISEVPAFMDRELEFRFLAVVPEALDGKPFNSSAVICARYSDDEFFHIRCKGSKEIYFQRCGRYNIEKIWRDDILPCRTYLRHCVLAAKNLGSAAYDNFLDHTFLGDRETTIRKYLATTGAGIIEEEPLSLSRPVTMADEMTINNRTMSMKNYCISILVVSILFSL